VTSVAFSPDGKVVSAGSADKTLTLWGTDGKLLKRIPLASPVKGIAYRSDNKTVAAGLEDGTIAFVDTSEGKEAKKLTGHKGAVTSVSFTPKGDALISASTDQTITRWDAESGAVLATAKHTGPVSCLALNREGTLCAAGSGKRCTVWSLADTKENKPIASFDAATDVRGIDFGPTSDCLVLAGADNNAHVYGLDGKRREYFPHDGAVVAVVTHPRDKLIITGSADKLVRIWQSPQLWQRSHAGPVRHALVSPKGDVVLSFGEDKTVRAWSVADGKEMLSFPAQEGAILGAAVTGDGMRLVTAGADRVVKLWEVKALAPDSKKQAPLATHNLSGVPQGTALNPSGSHLAVALGPQDSMIKVYELPSFRELVSLDGHPGGTHALAFHGENTLLSAGADKVARLDELPIQAVWPAHNGRVTALQYHPNGGQILTAGQDKAVILWDAAKRVPLRRFESLGEPVADAGFSRDGLWIAATGGKRAQVWNAGDGKPAVTIALPANGLAVALTADRSRLAVLCDNRETQVYEVATGKPLQFYRDIEPGKALAFHANNSLVRAAGKVVFVETMNVLRTLNGPGHPLRALAVTQNGANVLTGGADKGVKIWNASNGNLDRAIATDVSGITSVSISRNLALVAVGSEDKALRLLTFGDGKLQKSLQTSSPIRSLAFSPDDRSLATGSADGAVQVYNAVFNPNQPTPDFLQSVQSFSQPAATTGIVLANDNRTLYSTGPDKALRIWKLAADTPTRSFQHPNYVNALSFQPQGTMLASGGQDGKVRLFDLVKGAQLREINAHPTKDGTMIYAVGWTPDGKQVLTAGYDNSLRLFDAASGNKVREFRAYKVKEFEQGHQDSVFCAAISPDGKYVASGSSGLERVLKLWKAGDGTVVRDFLNPQLKTKASHPGWIYGVRFTRDGKYLVSVGDAPRNRGYLAVWNVEDGKLVLGEELPLGVFFTLDLAPESGLLAIGAGSRGTRANSEWNSAYLIRVPILTR
jgi:WD40 repeat protein